MTEGAKLRVVKEKGPRKGWGLGQGRSKGAFEELKNPEKNGTPGLLGRKSRPSKPERRQRDRLSRERGVRAYS